MKRLLSMMLVLVLALAVLGPSFAPVQGSLPALAADSVAGERYFAAGGAEAPVVRGLPERPRRDYPIPYHRPGQPAKTSVVNSARLAEAYGLSQPLTLTAALELGLQDDPLQGNYRLVDWDQLLLVGGLPASVEGWGVQAAELITESPVLAPPIQLPQYLAEAAWPDAGVGAVSADVNGDGCDESIAMYNDLATQFCRLAVGTMGDQAGRLTSAPAVGVFYEGATANLLAAVRGYEGGLWVNRYTDLPSEEDWVPLGGSLASAPAVLGGMDVAEVFYLDAGGDLYSVDVLADPPLAQSIGRPSAVALTLDPTAARWGTRTDVFVRGADSAVWHRARQGSTWSDWESLGGFTTSSPAAVWQTSDRLDLVVRGYDGALWHRLYTGQAWRPWQRVGGELASAPAVLSAAAGELDVFVLDAAGAVLHLPYTGGGWGSWESLGGELASAPAAALLPGGITHLLGRGTDHALWQAIHVGGSWGNWVLRGRLPRYVMTELPWTCHLDHRDQAAGHFLGDGREQVLLRDGDVFRLYQASSTGGFFMEPVDTYGPVTDDFWNDQGDTLAVGDFDGDGREEFAVLHTNGYDTESIWVYRFDLGTGHITPIAHHDWAANDYTHIYSVAAGDLDGGGEDELILASIWNGVVPLPSTTWWSVYSVDTGLQDLVTLYSTANTCPSNTRCAQAVSAANLDGAGPDEVAIAWLENNRIDVQVFAREAGDWQFALWDAETIDSRPASWAIRHHLHTADLDRNLRDELVLEFDDMDGGVQPGLHALYVDLAHQVRKVQAAWAWLAVYSGWADMDVGGLTGQGLQVGPPTYRQESSLNNILAVISDVPRHKDTLDGVEYNINADDLETYAKYSREVGHTNEVSVQAQRDWTLNTDPEATIGGLDGMNVASSLLSTYGRHFENTEGSFEESLLSETIITQGDDVVVFAGTDYDIWEYPLYQNDPTAPATYLTVVFQRGGGAGLVQHSADGGQCGFWFRPNHQNNNVWSYPPNTDAFLDIDPDPEHGIIMCQSEWTVGASQHTINVNWAGTSETKRTSETTVEIRRTLLAQVGGNKVLGFLRPFQLLFGLARKLASLQPPTEGTALPAEADVRTQATSVISSTLIEGNTMPIDDSARYNVQPCLYWARDGYLVLDWAANPQLGAAFWAEFYGGQPDPTFIRPYETGECQGQEDFSTDVYVNPPAATPGDVVTATAIVRNFSSVGAANVVVRFYVGDPDAGGVRIYAEECLDATLTGGDCRVDSLPGRARQEVSIVFAAGGEGEQRIYAVLDPAGAIEEVHEDNNKAYGRLQIAAAGFGDPGAGAAGYRMRGVVADLLSTRNTDDSWEAFVYTDTQNTPTAVMVPLLSLSEVTRIELRPVLSPTPPAGMRDAHHAFDLLAFQGAEGSEWTVPIDLTFGGGLPPALAVVHYSDTDWQPNEEADLVLQYWTGAAWEDAVCAGMEDQVLQSADENWLLVPVCRTGSYALFAPFRASVYLPLIVRN